jgi:hypothetical protein
MPLDIVARCFDRGLLSFGHPASADFGIQVHIHFILKYCHFLRWEVTEQLAQPSQFTVMFRVRQSDNRPRPPPGKPQSVQTATDQFAAESDQGWLYLVEDQARAAIRPIVDPDYRSVHAFRRANWSLAKVIDRRSGAL